MEAEHVKLNTQQTPKNEKTAVTSVNGDDNYRREEDMTPAEKMKNWWGKFCDALYFDLKCCCAWCCAITIPLLIILLPVVLAGIVPAIGQQVVKGSRFDFHNITLDASTYYDGDDKVKLMAVVDIHNTGFLPGTMKAWTATVWDPILEQNIGTIAMPEVKVKALRHVSMNLDVFMKITNLTAFALCGQRMLSDEDGWQPRLKGKTTIDALSLKIKVDLDMPLVVPRVEIENAVANNLRISDATDSANLVLLVDVTFTSTSIVEYTGPDWANFDIMAADGLGGKFRFAGANITGMTITRGVNTFANVPLKIANAGPLPVVVAQVLSAWFTGVNGLGFWMVGPKQTSNPTIIDMVPETWIALSPSAHNLPVNGFVDADMLHGHVKAATASGAVEKFPAQNQTRPQTPYDNNQPALKVSKWFNGPMISLFNPLNVPLKVSSIAATLTLKESLSFHQEKNVTYIGNRDYPGVAHDVNCLADSAVWPDIYSDVGMWTDTQDDFVTLAPGVVTDVPLLMKKNANYAPNTTQNSHPEEILGNTELCMMRSIVVAACWAKAKGLRHVETTLSGSMNIEAEGFVIPGVALADSAFHMNYGQSVTTGFLVPAVPSLENDAKTWVPWCEYLNVAKPHHLNNVTCESAEEPENCGVPPKNPPYWY